MGCIALQENKTMEGHRLRVGALAWSSCILSSGSRDKSILQRDIRCQEDHVSKLTGHKSEVYGLKWSYDNRELASGGNDNRLFVWNQHSTQPVLKYSEHTAAVKAIAWSPHVHGLLASGGGTADRYIHFWNTTTNTHLGSIDTCCSQVCNLAWPKNVNELVSTHGYSQNHIIVWKYTTMSKVTNLSDLFNSASVRTCLLFVLVQIATLTGHTYRVQYLAVSPDGHTIVTGEGDETLRFWNVFPPRNLRTLIVISDRHSLVEQQFGEKTSINTQKDVYMFLSCLQQQAMELVFSTNLFSHGEESIFSYRCKKI